MRRCAFAEYLAAFAAGTLLAKDAVEVCRHLRGCADCRADLADWRRIAETARAMDEAAPPPSPETVALAWAEVRHRRAHSRRFHGRMARIGGLAAVQARLVPAGVWPLSAAAVVVALIVALAVPRAGASLASLVMCAVGGAGAAFSCGPDADPCAELTLSMPVSYRALFLIRLALLFAFDSLLGLAGSGAAAALHGGTTVWGASWVWWGPMVAAGGLSALLAALWGSTVAAAGSLVVWSLRLFGGTAVAGQWHTSVPVLLAAGAMVAAGAAVRPRAPRAP